MQRWTDGGYYRDRGANDHAYGSHDGYDHAGIVHCDGVGRGCGNREGDRIDRSERDGAGYSWLRADQQRANHLWRGPDLGQHCDDYSDAGE